MCSVQCPTFEEKCSSTKPFTHNFLLARDVLEQTEMIIEDVQENAMEVYIKNQVSNNKKTNTSKFRFQKAILCFELQPKADHQGIKITLTDFR